MNELKKNVDLKIDVIKKMVIIATKNENFYMLTSQKHELETLKFIFENINEFKTYLDRINKILDEINDFETKHPIE